MDSDIPADLLRAYSQREMTRREIAERVDQEVSFGDLLGALHRHGLKLPRVLSDPQSLGVRLIHDLAVRGAPLDHS
jgi:hypothetical protein